MSVFTYKQRNNINLVIIIVLGCIIAYSMKDIIEAILSAVILYTIFRPVYLFLTNKWNWSDPLAAMSIILSSFVIIVIPFICLSVMVVDKLSEFGKDTIMIQNLVNKIDKIIGDNFHQEHFIEQGFKKLGTVATELFPALIGGAFNIFIAVAIMYFILYFMFTQYKTFENGLLRYAPFKEQHAIKFAIELKNTTYSNVLGQGLISLVQGMLVCLGFYIFGFNDPIFWGVICIFISFLPVIGSPVVFIPISIFQILNGNPVGGWSMMVLGLFVIMNIDNVIRFMINKKIADTHPIITIVGVIIGIPLFGILGLVFGPLLLSYFILLVKIYETNRLATERLERIRGN